MDLNMDGIEDGAEVTLQRKALDQNGVDQIMTAKWKYKRPSDPGGAYAGEHRGVMSNVGNRAATNAQYAGADMAGQARAGVEADAEFQPVSMMTPKGQVSGSDRTIQSIMDAESVPFARTATTNDVNAKSRSEYDAFNERSAANLRIMTGGRTSGGPEFGSEMDRGERTERAARIMESGSVRPDQRRLAAGTVARYMGEEEAAKSRISDQRIQQILSGGKVEEAQATAGGQVGAARETATGHVAATREMGQAQRDVAVTGAGAQRDVAGLQAGAQRDVAVTGAQAQRDVAGVQAGAQRDVAGVQAGAQRDVAATGAGAVKYGADQETVRAREAAKLALESQRIRTSGGAYQGEIVKHPSGMIGVWDDQKLDYKWERPPNGTAPTKIPGPNGVIEVGGSGTQMNLENMPVWKPTGSTRAAEAPTGGDPQREAAMRFIRDNPNDPRVPAIRAKLGL